MNKALLGSVIAIFGMTQASAETAFWKTCEFPGEGSDRVISFGLYASTGDGFLTFNPDEESRPITWYELGSTTHLFLDDVQPRAWVLSYDVELNQALTYAESHVAGSTICRGGAE